MQRLLKQIKERGLSSRERKVSVDEFRERTVFDELEEEEDVFGVDLPLILLGLNALELGAMLAFGDEKEE